VECAKVGEMHNVLGDYIEKYLYLIGINLTL
jgi:hypothetical protein